MAVKRVTSGSMTTIQPAVFKRIVTPGVLFFLTDPPPNKKRRAKHPDRLESKGVAEKLDQKLEV